MGLCAGHNLHDCTWWLRVICLHALLVADSLAPRPLSLLLAQTFSTVPDSLQLRSSDWSSQSASPSQRQPALMHRPLSHMNSPERQGWWEAGETHRASVSSQSVQGPVADQKATALVFGLLHLRSRGTRGSRKCPHPSNAPAPAGTCALPTQPGFRPFSTQLARALTAVRLVRPVSAVIIAIAVVNVEDAAAVGTLELFQVAGGCWHG